MKIYCATLKNSIIFIFLLYFISGYTQNTLQIIKFEEAQEMFNNNKFKEAVTILTDLENKGLKNPKVLHLKILAKSNYNNQDITEEVLGSLKSDVNKYLKDYDIKGLEDKYKEVYLVSKNLNKLEAILIKRNAITIYKNKEFSKALPLLLQAADMGNNEGDLFASIADTYKELSNTDNNYTDEIFKWKEKAAENGHIQSSVDVAYAYKEGNGVAVDFKKAAKYFRIAASANHPDGQYGMYWVYFYGVEGKTDREEALKWCSLAANNSTHHGEANLTLIQFFSNGMEGYSTNTKYALEKIIDKTPSTNHQDYYIRERAMLLYLYRFGKNYNGIELAEEIFKTFHEGADKHNSIIGNLYLATIYEGSLSLKGSKGSKLKVEKNKNLLNKYFTEYEKSFEKKNFKSISFFIAIDFLKLNSNLTESRFYLYQQAIKNGSFEAKQFLIYNAKILGDPISKILLDTLNVKY